MLITPIYSDEDKKKKKPSQVAAEQNKVQTSSNPNLIQPIFAADSKYQYTPPPPPKKTAETTPAKKTGVVDKVIDTAKNVAGKALETVGSALSVKPTNYLSTQQIEQSLKNPIIDPKKPVKPSSLVKITPDSVNYKGKLVTTNFSEEVRKSKSFQKQVELERKALTPLMQFTAGSGDVLQAGSSVARWLGKDGLADNLQQQAAIYQSVAEEDNLGEFNWKMLYDPRFYSLRVTRTLPFAISLIPAAVLGGYGGAAVAGAVGLGTFGTAVLGSIGAAGLSRPLEAALEGGSTYDEMIKKGKSKEEAEKAAQKTFMGNLSLASMDAAEFLAAFAPVKGGGRFWKRLATGGRVVSGMALEGGEEVIQRNINLSSQGENLDFTSRQAQEEFAIGSVMSTGLSISGAVYNNLKTEVKETNENVAAEYQKQYQAHLKETKDPKKAEMMALDDIAKKFPKEVEEKVDEVLEKTLAVPDFIEEQGGNMAEQNQVEVIEPVSKKAADIIDKFEANIASYKQSPGVTAGVRTVEEASLRDIAKAVNTPEIQEYTQARVQSAIETGELTPNEDGTITLYRAGNESTRNRLVSASYDRTVAETIAEDARQQGTEVPITEIKVQPEEIKAFIGKGEKEVLIQNPNVANAGLGDIKSYLSNKIGGKTESLPLSDNKFRIKTKDNEVYFDLADKPDGLHLIDIEVTNKNKGLGTKLINDIKAYADETGKPLKVHMVQNPKYFDKFDWLQSDGSGIRTYTPRVAEQPQGNKTIDVPRSQLPVGEGKQKVSRLEERILESLKNAPDEVKNLSTYNELTKKDQISKASKYVSENPEDALAVLQGKKEAPQGLLTNSIFVAMHNLGQGNVELGRKLATLSSTRAGQEIGILTEIDPNSPVKIMREIVKIREEAVTKKYKNKSLEKIKTKMVKEIKQQVKKPDKDDWMAFIDSIQC